VGSKVKSRYLAEQACLQFFRRHPCSYFWTFTTPFVGRKDTVVELLKPFLDLVKRRGGEQLHFWEMQKRGAWHVHLLTDVYLDVNRLRPWMVKRMWGPQMRVERIQASPSLNNGKGWVRDESRMWKTIGYLIKYITKAFHDSDGTKKKAFGGSASARCGTVRYAWCKWENPGSYLYAHGRDLWLQLYGERPRFRDMADVIRLGVEITDWLSVDPWWMPDG
jgi:hypothetical protein